MEHRYNHKIGSQEASYGYIYYVFKVFYRLQFYQFYNPFFVSLAKLAHFFIIAKQKDDFLLLTFDLHKGYGKSTAACTKHVVTYKNENSEISYKIIFIYT